MGTELISCLTYWFQTVKKSVFCVVLIYFCEVLLKHILSSKWLQFSWLCFSDAASLKQDAKKVDSGYYY